MDVTNGTDGTETPRKKKRQKTGGRHKGTPNKVTKEFRALRQSCQEIFKETLGLEMKVDPETGKRKITGKAVTVRQRLEKMFQGKIPVSHRSTPSEGAEQGSREPRKLATRLVVLWGSL